MWWTESFSVRVCADHCPPSALALSGTLALLDAGTRLFHSFVNHDEAYEDAGISPHVHAVRPTDHADGGPLIVWTHSSKKSQIVHLALARRSQVFSRPIFEVLVRRPHLSSGGNLRG
jgi:hypothetical protein